MNGIQNNQSRYSNYNVDAFSSGSKNIILADHFDGRVKILLQLQNNIFLAIAKKFKC